MINQPSEDDILQVSPAFQNKIIAMRQQIADKEMEIQRLNKEIISLNYTNEQLILQKKELEEQTPILIKKKDDLESQIKFLAVQSDNLKEDIVKSENELQNHKIQKETEAKTVYEAQNSLKVAKDIHEFNVSQLNKKQQEVNDKEDSLNTKLAKLREIIQ